MLQEPLLSHAAPAAIPRRCRELQRPAALIALLSTVGGILAICAVATRRLRAIGDGGPAAWEESPTLLKLQGTPQMMQMLARDMQTAPTIMRQLPPSGVTSVFSAAAATADAGGEKLPVVILHGMGDSGSNPGMQSLCQTVRDAFPGIYVVCSNVANGLSSITTPLADQVDEFAQSVRADERLANGFHSIGLSQGGLVLRGYVQQRRASDPKVHRLISVCTPHAGIGTCPRSPAFRLVALALTLALILDPQPQISLSLSPSPPPSPALGLPAVAARPIHGASRLCRLLEGPIGPGKRGGMRRT